jgi:hypothetical protein
MLHQIGHVHLLFDFFFSPHEELQKSKTTFHIVLMYDFHHLNTCNFMNTFVKLI